MIQGLPQYKFSGNFSGMPKIWHVLFVASLFSVFLMGPYLWCARVGWVVLAILFALDLQFAFYAIFFFSVSFHSAGFLMNFPLTIKHFHIAVWLALLIQLIRGELAADLARSLRGSRLLIPIAFVLLFGFLNLAVSPNLHALRTTGNLSLVVVLMFCVTGMALRYLENREDGLDILMRATKYFALAVIGQMFISNYDFIRYRTYSDMRILHNNHLGLLCAMAMFYVFTAYTSQKHDAGNIPRVLSLVFIFTGLIATLSRTAWIGFLFAFLVFVFLIRYQNRRWHAPKVLRLNFFLKWIFFFLMVGVLLFFFCEPFRERAKGLVKVLDVSYLSYTVHDKSNFGFLGAYRLRDLRLLREALSTHPFFGIGFTHEAVDMHGFYIMVICATGLLGLAVYLYGTWRAYLRVRPCLQPVNDLCSARLAAAAVCCLAVWFLSSFLETYFLQFSVWIHWVVLDVLVGLRRRDEG